MDKDYLKAKVLEGDKTEGTDQTFEKAINDGQTMVFTYKTLQI